MSRKRGRKVRIKKTDKQWWLGALRAYEEDPTQVPEWVAKDIESIRAEARARDELRARFRRGLVRTTLT